MSLGGIMVKMGVGGVGNKKRCCEASFFVLRIPVFEESFENILI
jgi:hypothetical protein